jgi:hypothetical protein
MTCIVRKTLADIGEVEQVKAIKTCTGKMVFDQATWLSNYTRLAHARFILNNVTNKSSMMRQYKIHQNQDYHINAYDSLMIEIACANTIIEKFNTALPILLSRLIKNGFNVNVSVTVIPTINVDLNISKLNTSINNTISHINDINLRSICNTCEEIPAVNIRSFEYEKIPDNTDMSIPIVTHAMEINISNMKKMALTEHDIANAISVVNTVGTCLTSYIKQLEEK